MKKKVKKVFIKTDDEKVAMPVGEYVLEDGKLLVVKEEGIIVKKKKKKWMKKLLLVIGKHGRKRLKIEKKCSFQKEHKKLDRIII